MIEDQWNGSKGHQARHPWRVVERPRTQRTCGLPQLEPPGRAQLESGLPLVSSSRDAGGILDPIRVQSSRLHAGESIPSAGALVGRWMPPRPLASARFLVVALVVARHDA